MREKEHNIMVVFTGGTISTDIQNGFLKPSGEKSRKLLFEKYEEQFQKDAETEFKTKINFDHICPYEILSENLNGHYLHLLYNCISEIKVEQYDGIIVTVGTDTLAYSAAALNYFFGNEGTPIVVVSSNYPLNEKRANGMQNFEAAVRTILEHNHQGVLVPYRNNDAVYIHRGSRLLQQLNFDDNVTSVCNEYYGKLVDGKIIKNPEFKEEKTKLLLTPQHLEDTFVIYIRPYPGMSWSSFETLIRTNDYQGIVLDTYHSGTMPATEQEFANFISAASQKNVPVLIVGLGNGMQYETVTAYEKPGIIIAPVASPMAMYIKFWLLLANHLPVESNLFQL